MVLLALADIANHEGECWPSVGTLTEMTCLGKTAVKDHVQALKDAGILEVEARHTQAGRQTSNFFRIHTDALVSWEGPESDPSRKAAGGGAEIRPGEGPKSDPTGGRNPTPQIRTEEPPKEPPQGTTPVPPPEASPGAPARGGDLFLHPSALVEFHNPVNDPRPTAEALRVAGWFNRRATTAWSAKEIKAWKALRITLEDLAILERYYTAPADSFTRDIRRRDLLTLLNNWPGELDRARAFATTPPPAPNARPRFRSTIGQ